MSLELCAIVSGHNRIGMSLTLHNMCAFILMMTSASMRLGTSSTRKYPNNLPTNLLALLKPLPIVRAEKSSCWLQDLAAALSGLRMGRPEDVQPLAFICGPPDMTEAVNEALLKLGLESGDIRFERWW